MNAALGPLDYRVPDGMRLGAGAVVIAPLGPRRITGIVWEADRLPATEVPEAKLRPIIGTLDVPPLRPQLRRLIEWTADYYCAPMASVARMVLASGGVYLPVANLDQLATAFLKLFQFTARPQSIPVQEEGFQVDPGIDEITVLRPRQAAQEDLQQTAHCNALPAGALPGMVEAQRLRDAALARAIVAAHHEAAEAEGPVIVITGNGHARPDWGVPALLANLPERLSVASVGQYEETAPDSPPFADWIVTPAVERPDPCAAFR